MAQEAGITCSEVWGGNDAADAALVLPGLQGWVLSRPYRDEDSGGDVHYVSSCGTGRITRVMLADVAGHGEKASGVAEFLRGVMQRYLNHIEPGSLAGEMNQRLSMYEANEGRFATAVIMTFFSPTGTMTLCNAGHPSPLIYKEKRQAWAAIYDPKAEPDVVNLPLGVIEEAGYTGRELVLEPGDNVLAYSDCLIEASNGDGKLLGVDGLLEVLNGMAGDDERELSEFSRELVRQIEARGYRMDDDLTAVLLHCVERTGGATMPERLAGVWRSVSALFSGRRIPWPELSIRNLGGMIVPALSQHRSRRKT